MKRSTKKKVTKKTLKKTNYTGDLIPSNLHEYGRAFVKSNAVVKVSLRASQSAFGGSVPAGTGIGYVFALSQITNYTDFTLTFDQYRFAAIEIRFMPYWNHQLPSANTQGRLFTCIDYDDANTPASANAIRDYPSCVVTQPWESVTRTFVPHTAEAAYSGTFTSFSNKENSWIDSASPGVQHFGLKAWCDGSTVAPGTTYSVEIRYFIEFRNPRAS